MYDLIFVDIVSRLTRTLPRKKRVPGFHKKKHYTFNTHLAYERNVSGFSQEKNRGTTCIGLNVFVANSIFFSM
jgi:hypothetical protein